MHEIVRLGDLFDFKNGRSFKKEEWRDEGIPIIRIQNLNNPNASFNYFDGGYDESVEVNLGDLLFSWSGTVGTSFGPHIWKKGKGVLNQHIFKLSYKKNIDIKYAYYSLLQITGEIEKNVVGAVGIVHVTKKRLNDFTIPLPPLAEQQRIVAKLDAAFAEIDKAIDTCFRNKDNSEYIYEYAIDELFYQHREKVEPLGSYSEINYGHTTKASFVKGTYKFLRITDIQDGNVKWENVPYCEVGNKKLDKVLLHDGDIVFARTGATTGKSLLVKRPVDAVFASYLIRVSINREKLLPNYVMHYFQSAEYWKQVNEGISGAAQGGFNATKLKELRIPITGIEEQINISNRLDSIALETKGLSEVYGKKIELLAFLKSAILAQELKGETA